MIYTENVHGTQEVKPATYEFNVDTIYIRTNIKKEKKIDELTKKELEFWVYDEIQMNQMEYLEYLQKETLKSQQSQDDMILDNAYRVAVLEISTGATLNI